MISVSCILALGVLSSGLGVDFHEGEHFADLQSQFGSDEETPSLEKSKSPWKRSSTTGLNEQTCTTLPGVDSVLQNNTHSVSNTRAHSGLIRFRLKTHL